ncbi:hypothetical protein KUTeg_010506 [Tegillarca granosa]|uniref:G-protein coupled receptors family 1 profile domain-containing protein n=1 Tax=Tegillarca granosa TaxID=220873 RepID=A0ABQ9F3L4_TEGGR|nr:hypothetical protein KUTeg_010506 [Tegillarca granosa]
MNHSTCCEGKNTSTVFDFDRYISKNNRDFLAGLYAIISLVTIFGNSFVLISIYKFKQFQTNLFLLLANLAISDLLVGLLVIPYEVVFYSFLIHQTDSDLYKYACLIRYTLGPIFLGASVWSLWCISVERYFAVIYPLKHLRLCTKNRLIALILTLWVIAITIGILPILGWNNWQPETTECYFKVIWTKSYLFILCVIYSSSLLSSIMMYIRVIYVTLLYIKRIKARFQSDGKHTRMSRNFTKTKIAIFIHGIFAICWTPFFVFMFCEAVFLKRTREVVVINFIVRSFGIFNTSINWIIFSLKNNLFQTSFRACQKARNTTPPCTGKLQSAASVVTSGRCRLQLKFDRYLNRNNKLDV